MMISASKCRPLNSAGRFRRMDRQVIRAPHNIRNTSIQSLEAAEPVKSIESQRETSKKERVLVLLKTDRGATLEQLMSATGWQSHSVRGFLARLARRWGFP